MLNYPITLLEHLYRTMLRIRLCEESFVEPILSGAAKCPVHLYSGQEAIAAGIGANLDRRDYIFGSHRSHGHYLAKGGDMNQLVAEIFTKETGCSRGRGGSMHLIDPENGMLGSAPIVAGTISLALGAALASSIRKEDRVTVSYFGDGATGEGVLYECLNFAALKKLPIIFVCENNLYSTHMPINEIRTKKDVYEIAHPFDIMSVQVDGNDVLKVYDVSKTAVENCRQGKGPCFLEFMTYRFRGHVGPDDNIQGSHTDIRPKSEIEKWMKKDPLTRLESFFNLNGLSQKIDIGRIKTEVETEVRAAHQFATKSNNPDPGELNLYVFQ